MVKIALVVPCENFIAHASQILSQHNRFHEQEDSETYVMDEIIMNNSNAGHTKIDADIILTRGLLAQILANLPGDIPVVQISVPTADILRTIRKCTRLYGQKQIGIIAAGNMLAGITGLSDLCDVPIKTYLLSPNWNNEALADQAIREGCQVILGGLNTCRYAQMIHVPNMLIETSEEAFWDALSSAKRALHIFRKEQEKSMRLQTILDISHDGIIFIDPSRRVTTANKKAQSIFGLDKDCLGKRIIDIPFPLELKNLLSDNNEYANKILQYNRTLLSISKTFVKTQTFLSGSIVNIQLVNEIQWLEGDIRKQLHQKGLVAKLTFSDMIGSSPSMASVIKTAKKYSRTNSNILLIGESGTGKEVLAQSIHNASPRSLCPFVAVNCAAIPDTLLESELFGYVPGAFTGAQKSGKTGLFELAHTGTIFLDEIGEIPLPLQAKLLRVLQEREIMRVGGDSVIHVDIRIIAATNKNLENLVKDHLFREDLFYRLDVLRITIPPLNQRREDIPLLAADYMGKNFPGIRMAPEVVQFLSQADWTGNVRHLFNICERMAVLCSDYYVDLECAKLAFPECHSASGPSAPDLSALSAGSSITGPSTAGPSTAGTSSAGTSSAAHRAEESRILEALAFCRFNKGQAASMLGMSRSTLWRKMKEYHIEG